MQGVLVAAGVVPSSAPVTGVCGPWATDADVCTPCTSETPDIEPWLQIATDLLYELSGQRFPGICADVVRPCAQTCNADAPRYYGDSVPWRWYGSCSCGGDACGCTTLSEISLSGWPLVSIEEVLMDGAVLSPSVYRIDDWSRLVRVDGQAWPACQDLAAATTEDDTFQITFMYGVPPPPAAIKAAASLGCQLALACAGSSDCRLPQRVQSITRQGVSMVMLDPFTFFDDGRTGLYDVDLFLAAYGVTGKKRWPALIVNPDAHRRVRHVTG